MKIAYTVLVMMLISALTIGAVSISVGGRVKTHTIYRPQPKIDSSLTKAQVQSRFGKAAGNSINGSRLGLPTGICIPYGNYQTWFVLACYPSG